MARAKQPGRGTTKEETPVEAADTTASSTGAEETIEPAEATEAESSVPSAQEGTAPIEAPVPAEEATPAPRAEELVSVARDQVEAEFPTPAVTPAVPAAVHAPIHAPIVGTIMTEMADYSRRSVENATIFVRKLIFARSIDSVVRIQSEYAKSSYVDFVIYVTKLGELYSKLATEAIETHSPAA
jgi:hypothetical protein